MSFAFSSLVGGVLFRVSGLILVLLIHYHYGINLLCKKKPNKNPGPIIWCENAAEGMPKHTPLVLNPTALVQPIHRSPINATLPRTQVPDQSVMLQPSYPEPRSLISHATSYPEPYPEPRALDGYSPPSNWSSKPLY